MPANTGPALYHLPGFYEPFNAISHLLAVVVFTVLGWKLLRRGSGSRRRVAFLSIYVIACVFLLSMSAVFHMMERGGTASRVMERLDHGGIFVLITGTFTAVHGMVFRGWRRWVPLIAVWILTIACITLKTVFFESLPEWVGLSFYVGLGWGVGLTAIPILRRHGLTYLAPLFYGGAAYSLGAIMDYMGWFVVIPGVIHSHEIWHVAVLAGALLHWRFVWSVVNEDLVGGHTRALAIRAVP
ncbi:MAG: PAQR family membrane homeostasis protein TrhA [Planctomycetota bacterium]|jgi:channel protein (hemolysin III family)